MGFEINLMYRETQLQLGKQIEQTAGGILRVHFQCQPPNKPMRYVGLILPQNAPFYLPIDRNRENATVWVEATTAEDIYKQLTAMFGIDYPST